MNARALVVGARGNTGRPLVAELGGLGLAVRTAGLGGPPPGHRGEHVRFDWHEPSTHDEALAGIGRMYLVAPALVDDPADIMIRLLERALRRGVRRAVLLSSSAVPEGAKGLGTVHRFLRERMPEWAVLQPSWFMQNFTQERHHHGGALKRGGPLLTATGDGKVAFVDARDIAAVGARALADPVSHNNAHLITGPRALSYDEIAAAIARASGREVRHLSVGREGLVASLEGAGLPAAYARLLAGLDDMIRRGEQARVADAVRRVAGREPRTFEAFAAEHAAAWA